MPGPGQPVSVTSSRQSAVAGLSRSSLNARCRSADPWNGDLETAAVLFIASNPSISFDEDFPTATWEDERVVAFFADRFGTLLHAQAPGGDRIRVHPAFVGAVYRRVPLKELRGQRTLAICIGPGVEGEKPADVDG